MMYFTSKEILSKIGNVRTKIHTIQMGLKKYIRLIANIFFDNYIFLKIKFYEFNVYVKNFVSIYAWYPSLTSFVFTFSLALIAIYFSNRLGIYAIKVVDQSVISNNLHSFFIALFGSILSIILFVGSSSGRDSSFDRSRVLFKTFFLFPLIVVSVVNAVAATFLPPENLFASFVLLILFTLFSMIKLFDSMLNRQQFDYQRKIIATKSLEILHPLLKVPQKILMSELFAFAGECHIHLSSGNITSAQSSVENFVDITTRIGSNFKKTMPASESYKLIYEVYIDSINLCNQILLSSVNDNQIEVFITASYPIKLSASYCSTKDVEFSRLLLRNISKKGFSLSKSIKLRKYLWEALVVCDKHSFLDTAYIQIINNCHEENYNESIDLVENILSEASDCIRFCIETEDLKNFQMIENTIKYIAQNGFGYPQCLSRSSLKLREESRSLAKQHLLGILAWTLSKEKPNYEIHLFELLHSMPKKVSALWEIFESIIQRENEEDFIWTSIGLWMEGSGSWCGSVYEHGYLSTIIILIFFIHPQMSEDFLFPKRILKELLDVTEGLRANYPSKIFKNDSINIKDFFSFLTLFEGVIRGQQSKL